MSVFVVAQFTAKTINSEKPGYFLTLMSYSVNKKSLRCYPHLKISRGKNFFASGNGGGRGTWWFPAPLPFSAAMYYEHIMNICVKSRPAISSALSLLFSRDFFLLYQNKNLLEALKQ